MKPGPIDIIVSLILLFLVGTTGAEETIKLPVRVHLMAGAITHAPTGTNMVGWVTESEVPDAITQINAIWKQANIEFYVEKIFTHRNLGSAEDIAYITNAKRDSDGKSDPKRIPRIYNCFDKTKHHPKIQNLYFFQFTGNTSQGYAGVPGNRNASYLESNYAVVCMWSNKHSGGLRPPERALAFEAAPGKSAADPPQDENYFKRGSLVRTCAHELGHNLTLPHPQDVTTYGRLMGGPSGHGYKLTASEISKARAAAETRRRRADDSGLYLKAVDLPKFVKIKSLQTGKYLVADSNGKWIYANQSGAIVWKVVSGAGGTYAFEAKETGMWLSYRNSTGAVKLYQNNDDAWYEVKGTAMDKTTILNSAYNQYMWVSGRESPYISQRGDPINSNARWVFEEVSE